MSTILHHFQFAVHFFSIHPEVKLTLEKLQSFESENENNKKNIEELEVMRETFKNISSLQNSLDEKEAACCKIEETVALSKENTEKKRIESLAAETQLMAAYAEYSQLFSQYLHGISGILAKELKDDIPCPVCGSVTHPAPALNDCDFIDKDILDKKDAEIKEKTGIRDKLKKILAESESVLNEEQTKLQQVKLEIEKEKAVIENMRQGLKTDIKNLEELQREIDHITKEIKSYEDELSTATDYSAELTSKLIAQQAAIEMAEKEYLNSLESAEKSAALLKNMLCDNGFEDEEDYLSKIVEEKELLSLQRELSEYKTEVNHLQIRLAELKNDVDGCSLPDIDVIRKNLEESEQRLLSFNSENALLATQIDDSKKTEADLKQKFKKFLSDDEKNKNDMLFAKRIRGDSGIGIQRYLLGVVLSYITAEANRLLANVHSGRYRLLRTLEKSGSSRKTGLELEVYDSFTGERRSVSTLSGGEKFLVSLSLSIGLSTVVQSESGGVKIETMFIDEGFGSLDTGSIADALTVLGKMNNAGSLIGIISHVEELKDNISAQIEVKKERSGSEILIHI